jgi:hypothetical protein
MSSRVVIPNQLRAARQKGPSVFAAEIPAVTETAAIGEQV